MENKNILWIGGGLLLVVIIILLLTRKKRTTLPTNTAPTTSFWDSLYVKPKPLPQVDMTTLATADDIRSLQQAINVAQQKGSEFGLTPVAVTGTYDANTIMQLRRIEAGTGIATPTSNLTKRMVDFYKESLIDSY